jgi:hypothetical protein
LKFTGKRKIKFKKMKPVLNIVRKKSN